MVWNDLDRVSAFLLLHGSLSCFGFPTCSRQKCLKQSPCRQNSSGVSFGGSTRPFMGVTFGFLVARRDRFNQFYVCRTKVHDSPEPNQMIDDQWIGPALHSVLLMHFIEQVLLAPANFIGRLRPVTFRPQFGGPGPLVVVLCPVILRQVPTRWHERFFTKEFWPLSKSNVISFWSLKLFQTMCRPQNSFHFSCCWLADFVTLLSLTSLEITWHPL